MSMHMVGGCAAADEFGAAGDDVVLLQMGLVLLQTLVLPQTTLMLVQVSVLLLVQVSVLLMHLICAAGVRALDTI